MPALSLVICIRGQRRLLERLLEKATNCYDELIVIHDGPELIETPAPSSNTANTAQKPLAIDFTALPASFKSAASYQQLEGPPKSGSVHEVVVQHQGRFFEAPRTGSLEGLSPFAWFCAANDWILRLDADEFPGQEMKDWIAHFREMEEPEPSICGYTCIWPIWNGKRAITKRWPAGRIFLFNRRHVRFFGLVEQTPIPDGRYEALPLILHHQPCRRSHGLRNVLFRKQAYTWRKLIARGLLGKPTDLPRWRWDNDLWPDRWEEVRRNPIRTAFLRLVIESLRTLRDLWKYEGRILFNVGLNGPLHHAIFCIQFWWLRRLQKGQGCDNQTGNHLE